MAHATAVRALEHAHTTPLLRAIAHANNYYDDQESERRQRLVAMWQLCPLYVALERGGHCVVLDGCFRPICRVYADERVKILAPDAEYHAIGRMARLHSGFSFPPELQAERDRVRRYIAFYRLGPELRERWTRLRRGELSGGRGW